MSYFLVNLKGGKHKEKIFKYWGKRDILEKQKNESSPCISTELSFKNKSPLRAPKSHILDHNLSRIEIVPWNSASVHRTKGHGSTVKDATQLQKLKEGNDFYAEGMWEG